MNGRSYRIALVLSAATCALLASAAGPAGPRARRAATGPDADLVISEARWVASLAQLRARGISTTGAPVPVFDGEDGVELGVATPAGGENEWRFVLAAPPTVPCRVVVVSGGLYDEAAVTGAPADCGPPLDGAPSCTITPPAQPLPVGEPVVFVARATDPEALPLAYSWHFGGSDAALSGEVASGVPFATPLAFEIGGQAFPVRLSVTDAAGATAVCSTSVLVGEAPPADRPPVAERPAPVSPLAQDHALLAFNDLGMHCADLGSVPFSVLPPFNVVNAQVFARDAVPRRLDAAAVELRYSAASSAADPVVADPLTEPPSINSTSRNFPVGAYAHEADIRKTDLWDPLDPADPEGPTVVGTLFGADPPPDQGLATVHNQVTVTPPGTPGRAFSGFIGRRMPGFADAYAANDPQPFSTFQEAFGWFKAEGVPITPVDDYGRTNAYPLLRVEAVDAQTGAVLAALDAVVPVSTEVDCRDCHRRGAVGADPDARAEVLPFVDPAPPGDRVEQERAAKTNVLVLHDALHQLDDTGAPRYEPPLTDSGTVLCAACHNSFALEEVTGGGLAGDPELANHSAAVHGFHGLLKVDAASGALVRDADGEPVTSVTLEPGEARLLPADPTDPDLRMEQSCFTCHPGKITQCFRGAMFAAGLQCSHCHGDMLAVGGTFAGDFDRDGTLRARLPWRDEPRCESCHRGDAVAPGEAGQVTRLAFDPADPAAVPALATNRRFAENLERDPVTGAVLAATLYRNSLDAHGGPGRDAGVACEGCHGSPHAIWGDATATANDDVAAVQLQGHAGTVRDCRVCHAEGSFPNGTLDGPHGLHPIADPWWVKSDGGWHGRFAKDWSNGDPCAPCHGVAHLGTRLSRTPVARELRDAEGRLWATVAAGEEIRCDRCHTLEKSFGHD